MKIFIDFDGVIFDAEKFKKTLARICRDHGISRKDFLHTYEALKKEGGVYTVVRHVRALAKHTGATMRKKELHAAIDRYMSDLRQYVFKDALRFFDRMRAHELYLLSFGDPAFQKQKIHGSGVKYYFKRVIVTRGNKGKEISALRTKKGVSNERIVFIDDSEKHLREVRGNAHVVIIHLKRGKRGALRSVHADHHVSTLAQATRVILSL